LAEETKSTPRPPETDGVSGCACGTINNNLARVRAQSHFEEMGRGKRAGRWRAVVWPHLHIDDGSMGGGGPIDHENVITMTVTQPGYKNFYDDYKGRDSNGNGRLDSNEVIINPNDGKPFFSHLRSQIFRYTIICHTYGTMTQQGFKELTPEDGVYGVNDPDGNDDILILGITNTNPHEMALTFMHELGNNLGLDDNYVETETCMNPYSNTINYMDWEWAIVDPSLVTDIGGG